MDHGHVALARGMWLAVETYLRPSELLGCRKVQLQPPVPQSVHARHWVLSLHLREEGIPSKTGHWDESLAMDLGRHSRLSPVFAKMVAGPPMDPLVPYSGSQWLRFLQEAAHRQGLEALFLVPYACRHAGASGDVAAGLRSLENVQARGRWRSFSSVRRYEKSSRLNEQLNKLRPEVRARAVKAEQEIAQILLGR